MSYAQREVRTEEMGDAKPEFSIDPDDVMGLLEKFNGILYAYGLEIVILETGTSDLEGYIQRMR